MKKFYLAAASTLFMASVALNSSAQETWKATISTYNQANDTQVAETFVTTATTAADGEKTAYTISNIFDSGCDLKFRNDFHYGNGTYDIVIIDPYEGNGMGGQVQIANKEGDYLEIAPKPINGAIDSPLSFFFVNANSSRVYIDNAEKGNCAEIYCSGYSATKGWQYMWLRIEFTKDDSSADANAINILPYNRENDTQIAETYNTTFETGTDGDHTTYTIKNLFDSGCDLKFRSDYHYGNGTYDIAIIDPYEGSGIGGQVQIANNDGDYLEIAPKPIDGAIDTPLTFFFVNTIVSRVYIDNAEKGNYAEIYCAGYGPRSWQYMWLRIDMNGKGSVEGIEIDNAADAPVEFYNLQGIRVNNDNMVPGIYVRRQGNKVEKVLIK